MTSQSSLSDSLRTFPKAEQLSDCVTWDTLHSALLRDGEQLQQVGHGDRWAVLMKYFSVEDPKVLKIKQK